MATDEDYPIDLPILVIEAQIFVAVKKFPFLPNKQIPSAQKSSCMRKRNRNVIIHNLCNSKHSFKM